MYIYFRLLILFHRLGTTVLARYERENELLTRSILLTPPNKLGNGGSSTSDFVLMDGALSGKQITKIAAGLDFFIVLTNNGEIFGWFVELQLHSSQLNNLQLVRGSNSYGQLCAFRNESSLSEPVAADKSTLLATRKVVQIAAGSRHTMLLFDTGEMAGCGLNLGNISPIYLFAQFYSPQLSNLDPLNGETPKMIAAYADGTVILTTNGTIFWSGVNWLTNSIVSRFTKLRITDEKITNVDCKNLHCLATTSSGKLFSWGSNENAQLGTGNRRAISVPFEVLGGHVKSISAGYQSSLILMNSTDGEELYAWGFSVISGDGTARNWQKPVQQVFLPRQEMSEITQIDAGLDVFYFLTRDHKVYSWGTGSHGLLGDEIAQIRARPYQLDPLFTKGERIEQIRCFTACVALTEDNRLVSWG